MSPPAQPCHQACAALSTVTVLQVFCTHNLPAQQCRMCIASIDENAYFTAYTFCLGDDTFIIDNFIITFNVFLLHSSTNSNEVVINGMVFSMYTRWVFLDRYTLMFWNFSTQVTSPSWKLWYSYVREDLSNVVPHYHNHVPDMKEIFLKLIQ